MNPLIFVWLGVAAVWFTHHGFARTYADDRSMETVVGALAAVLWGVFAMASRDINTFDSSGNAVEVGAQSLLFVGLLGAAVMLLFTFQAATGSLQDLDTLDVTEVGR